MKLTRRYNETKEEMAEPAYTDRFDPYVNTFWKFCAILGGVIFLAVFIAHM